MCPVQIFGNNSNKGSQEECVKVIGKKARGKETTRETKTEWEGVDWIGLAKSKDNWGTLVNVMNFQVP
jgi:hypothetical protein